MSGDVLVEVAIGLILLYLLIALFCTAIQEWFAQLFNSRANHLKKAIKVLLSGSEQSDAVADKVLKHPLVKMLAIEPRLLGPRDPSYLPARNFVNALLRTLTPAEQTVAGLKESVKTIANEKMRDSVLAIIARAEASHQTGEDQMRATLAGLESWYDAAMDHASGWYKRRVRWFLPAIAFVLTVRRAPSVIF